MNLNTTILAWQSCHLTNRGISSRNRSALVKSIQLAPASWPSLSKGPRGYWHALSRTDDSLDPWKQPRQSSSKPHINKDLCHLKQPYLSKCERFGHELHEPIKKCPRYSEHPYKACYQKKTSQHSNAARVLWAMWPDLWREHSTAPQWGR